MKCLIEESYCKRNQDRQRIQKRDEAPGTFAGVGQSTLTLEGGRVLEKDFIWQCTSSGLWWS